MTRGLALWSAVFAAGIGAVAVTLALGVNGDAAMVGVTVGIGGLLLVMERLLPHEPAWLEPDGQWWQDIGHFLFNFGGGVFGGTLLAQALVPSPVWAVWPRGWPMAAQAVLGLLVAEFFNYWLHRAWHTVPGLWPIHALHHSTGRMTFFKATRIHATDIGTATFLGTATLLALAAPAEVLLWVTAFGNFVAQTQHANVAFRTPRWLDRVVGTPANHWLHHSIDLREGNSNFGMNLMIFDHLFGTYLAPGEEPPPVLGIPDDPVPRTFLAQVAHQATAARALFKRT
jgi:sterol desaturase/sphingolipid hydroxylase (fatty acid hydroxylase superfamily)